MRIIQIGPYPLSPDCIHGGVEASVFGLTQELAQSNDVHVFDVPRIGGEDRVEQEENLTIHRYTNPGPHSQDAVKRAHQIFREIMAINPNVCHIHGTKTFSKQLYFMLKKHEVPVIVTVHGLCREEKKQALISQPSLKHLYQYLIHTKDERTLLNAVQNVIVDTKYVEDKINAYNLHHSPNIFVIPQGIDDAYFHVNCNPHSNLLISVGAITPRKGHSYTIEMFNQLRDKGVEASLKIIGIMVDKSYYNLLQRQISSSPYAFDISIETNLSQKELFRAYESAKIFVLHSREESQGIVFAEAMACGLPVVATKVGGIPNVVENEKNGLLCHYGDVTAMTDMVMQLLSDNRKWIEYSNSARNTAEIYNWRKITDRIMKIYNQIISNQ